MSTAISTARSRLIELTTLSEVVEERITTPDVIHHDVQPPIVVHVDASEEGSASSIRE